MPTLVHFSLILNVGHRLQPNGLRVQSLIPELLYQIPGHSAQMMIHCSSLDENIDILVDNDISPNTMRERFGFPVIGVWRPEFQRLLIDTAEKYGIEIRWARQAHGYFEGGDHSEERPAIEGIQKLSKTEYDQQN